MCVFTDYTTFVLKTRRETFTQPSLLSKGVARQSPLSLQTTERAAAQNLSKFCREVSQPALTHRRVVL